MPQRILLFVLLLLVNPAQAGAPYYQQFPKNGIFNIVVLGDSLADGLHQGLTRLNKDRQHIKTIKKSKVNTGLVRSDRYDWAKIAKKTALSGKYQAVVVLLGLNDMQTIREKGKAHHYRTDGWKERYIGRVESMMRDLKKSGVAVYWVSNPIVTKSHYQEEILYLNSIYQRAAEKIGIRFIDTWKPLADKNGEYTPYYTGQSGKKIQIRRRDGVHFTPNGYLILAEILNQVLLQDIKAVSPKLTDDELATP